MTIGDKVLVKNNKYKDLPGVVIGYLVNKMDDYEHNNCAVKVTGHRNPKGASGNYYFDSDCISLYQNDKNKENKNMIERQLIKGYKVAKVEFEVLVKNGQKDLINYALYDDAGVKENDYVLCAAEDHMQIIGKVVKIEPEDTEAVVKHNREIICKIDYSMYDERQERIVKLAKLKEKMAKKREELNELAVYQALAKDCPEMAEMLKEFNELM